MSACGNRGESIDVAKNETAQKSSDASARALLDSSKEQTHYAEQQFGLRLLPFRYEQFMLDLVYMGEVEQIETAFSLVDSADFYVDLLSSNPAEQQRITAISTIALLTRTAIMAGVDESRAYRYGNEQIRNMAMSLNPDEFRQAMVALATRFAELVRSDRSRGLSPLVRRAQVAIRRMLHKRVTIADVAREVGVSREYLATVFKRETGQTVMGYVHREKIQQAKTYLLSDKTSIGEIADLFAYSSVSHFGRVFKSINGMTPSAWRCNEAPVIERARRA